MNVFVVDTDIQRSCEALASADPRRARKQLMECAQVLASVERNMTGTTSMRRKDGDLYRHAHPHHTITRLAGESTAMFDLTYNVAIGLSRVFPKHATATSIRDWRPSFRPQQDKGLVICRRGMTPVYTNSLELYTNTLRAYLISNKGVSALKEAA